MSRRNFKQHYETYSRVVLMEFMKSAELDKLDEQYTKAKLKREIRRLTSVAQSQLKPEIVPIRKERVSQLKAELKEI